MRGLAALLWLVLAAAADACPNIAARFAEAGVTGTMVVLDGRPGGKDCVHDPARAEARFSPASTFKIPHTLFALDAGVIAETTRFRWDGTARDIPAWNADQTLRTAMRTSTVWVYQDIARRLGLRREQAYLQRLAYGSQTADGGLEAFWLNRGLTISAREQAVLMAGLAAETLPFRRDHQRFVKSLILIEAGRDWRLHGKTGFAGKAGGDIGWFVGFVDREDGIAAFALNMDMAEIGLAPLREQIARRVLEDLQALPAPPS